MTYNRILNQYGLRIWRETVLVLGLLSITCISYGQENVKSDKLMDVHKHSVTRNIHLKSDRPLSVSNPLTFINGKVASDYGNLDPDSIKSITAIKPGDPKLALYGPKGVYGVVFIETNDSLGRKHPEGKKN